MKKLVCACVLTALAVPAAAQTIEVGKADWNEFPRLSREDRRLPYEDMVGAVETILAEKACRMRGQHARRFDITVPYAVLVEPDGSASRIVVADMACAPLETIVGNVVADLAELGDFRDAAGPSARWYSSDINFTLQ